MMPRFLMVGLVVGSALAVLVLGIAGRAEPSSQSMAVPEVDSSCLVAASDYLHAILETEDVALQESYERKARAASELAAMGGRC